MTSAFNETDQIARPEPAACKTCDELLDLLRRLLDTLPHEWNGFSNGCCTGCHTIHWPTFGAGKEPCKPDCVLTEAIRVVEKHFNDTKGKS